MTERFGRLSHPRKVPAADAQTDGAVAPASNGLLTGMISDILRTRWVEAEPGEGCFDHDETRMGLLLSFIDGGATPEECDSVRDHLLKCPRCRFLYARLREAPPIGEPVADLLRSLLRSTGPVVFPGEEVTEGAWEFGLLGELPYEVAERTSGAVAEQACRRRDAIAFVNQYTESATRRDRGLNGPSVPRHLREDIVQEVHLELLERLGDDYPLRIDEALRSGAGFWETEAAIALKWSFWSAISRARYDRQRQARAKREGNGLYNSSQLTADGHCMRRRPPRPTHIVDLGLDLDQVLCSFDETEKRIWQGRVVEGKTVREIGSEIGMSFQKVASIFQKLQRRVESSIREWSARTKAPRHGGQRSEADGCEGLS